MYRMPTCALHTHNLASHPLIVGFESALKSHPLRIVTILLKRLFRPLGAHKYGARYKSGMPTGRGRAVLGALGAPHG